MKKGQIAVIALAAVAVGLMAVFASSGGGGSGGGHGGSGGSSSTPQRAPQGAITISFYYSPEKAALMQREITGFNASGARIGGHPVFVEGHSIASGDAETQIATGQLQPTVWSPAGSLWGRLLDFEADKPYVADVNPSIVRTPLVIAMWRPMAQALGWPAKPLGFADLASLARDPNGWSAFGHPEYGRFALVHTNPDFSTAGLEAVVAEYAAATGKTEGLQVADLNGAAHRQVRDLEHAIVHYGDTTLFVADQLVRDGPSYASAAILEEATLLDVNRRLQQARSPNRLVAIYPKEGTFFSDSPFIVMNAPWVSGDQRAAAQAFGRYLATQVTARMAAQFGFRPANPALTPASPITAAGGVDPTKPSRLLGLPSPRVLAAIKRSWFADRKPANILLVLDTSGSMNDQGRLAAAKAGIGEFIHQAAPQDRIGMLTFSDQIIQLAPIATLARGRAQLQARVRGIIASGGTALFDATARAVRQVKALADTSRINAVVLLTDGEDTDSTTTSDQLLSELRAQGDSSRRVRVFTIAFSADAAGSRQVLAQISQVTGGQAYIGTPQNVQQLYRSISSFF